VSARFFVTPFLSYSLASYRSQKSDEVIPLKSLNPGYHMSVSGLASAGPAGVALVSNDLCPPKADSISLDYPVFGGK